MRRPLCTVGTNVVKDLKELRLGHPRPPNKVGLLLRGRRSTDVQACQQRQRKAQVGRGFDRSRDRERPVRTDARIDS